MWSWLSFKVLHVLAGVFWTGSAVFIAAYLLPSVRAVGPAGAPVMRQIAVVRRLPVALHAAGGLSLVTGIALYAHLTAGFHLSPWSGAFGHWLLFGSVSGVIAVLWGIVVQGRIARQLVTATASIEGPPSPEQLVLIRGLQHRLHRAAIVGAVLLVLALVGMALSHPI